LIRTLISEQTEA